MEQLQEGYVAAVAATAGCTAQPFTRDVHGFDLLIIRPAKPPAQEVSVYVQIKNTTTTKPNPHNSHFSYQLKQRVYFERLAAPRRDPKALLLVMVTSPEQAQWTVCTHDAMTLQHGCYWLCLEGETIDPKVQSPTIHVPLANLFDAAALRAIMDKLDRGLPLK